MNRIEQIIEQLQLKPHPEGGYFRETYRSSGKIVRGNDPSNEFNERHFATSIYFLLTADNFSAFHRITPDEQWHFYEGSSIDLHLIDPQGIYTKVSIGNRYENGEVYQYVVPGGNWFAASLSPGQSYALVGCTVAPGFEFEDFTLAMRKELTEQFPQHAEIIARYTHC